MKHSKSSKKPKRKKGLKKVVVDALARRGDIQRREMTILQIINEHLTKKKQKPLIYLIS